MKLNFKKCTEEETSQGIILNHPFQLWLCSQDHRWAQMAPQHMNVDYANGIMNKRTSHGCGGAAWYSSIGLVHSQEGSSVQSTTTTLDVDTSYF